MYKILIVSFLFFVFEINAQGFYQINFGAAATRYNLKQSWFNTTDYSYRLDLGYRLGIDFNQNISSKWGFQTGIRMIVFTSNLYQRNLTWSSEFVNGQYVFDPTLPHEGAFITKDYFVEVPFLIKYNIFKKKKCTYFADWGIAANMLVLTESINKLENSPKLSSSRKSERIVIVPSFLLGVGAEYNYKDKFSFIARPNFTHTRNPINFKLSQGFSSYFYYGIDLGLKIPF